MSLEESNGADLGRLVEEIKSVSETIASADEQNHKQLEEVRKSQTASDGKLVKLGDELKSIDGKFVTLEQSVNDILKKMGRPGGEVMTEETIAERKEACSLLAMQHELKVKKKDAAHPFEPSEDDIRGAVEYRKALSTALSVVDANQLPAEMRKSLSAFAFGNNAFILAPEMSNRVVRCIVDPTDLGGLFDSMTTSAPSVRFMIDNARMFLAAWACESSCFANNPQPDLPGLGEMEIKPETIRYVQCVTRDLLEDASANIENWILQRVSDGIRATINYSLINGTGVGMPMGILNPNAGIPVCETSPVTQPGQFTWQDLVMLKYEIPMEWQEGCSFFMNQRTFALLCTMSDTSTRPLWTDLPEGTKGFSMLGSPIRIVSQMPDVAPGATPIAYGNWKRVYMIVWRKAITMQQDPYSAGFCVLYKFEARVGGGVMCPNAARLLRIK